MPNAFNFAASPFDCLNLDEQRLVQDSVDIAYFPEGAVVLEVGAAPTHLFIPIKGYVTQTEGDEVLATYGPDDSFDGRGLVAGRVSSRFVAAQEVVAYQLARATVKELIARNTTFGALLFSDIGHKLSALAQRPDQHERQSLTLARVDAAYLRPAHTVEAGCDIVSVVRLFQAQRTTSVLVTGLAGGLGIFTNTTLQRAILDGRPLDRLAVGELASRPVVTVRASDQLGDAMALLLRERVHRVVVLDDEEKGGGVRGILEALDLFSFLANHSHLITVQIEQAQDLPALAQAAAQITRLIAALHRGGTRIGLMAKLVQQLNARLFERAWSMVAPAELVAHSCLFVMGSEGRGEQLLKTDQDNGLLLRDGYTAPHDLDAICQRFSDVLERFGYPECPGRIMLSNPDWRGTASEFTRRVRQWLLLPEARQPDEPRHLPRRARGGGRRRAAGRCAARPDGAGHRQRRPGRALCRGGPAVRQRRRLVEPAARPGRRCAPDQPEEGRHLPDRARRAQPGAGAARHCDRHGRARGRAGGRRHAGRPARRGAGREPALFDGAAPEGRAGRGRHRPRRHRQRRSAAPEQPGARPAQGRADGGQALQGAAAPAPAAGRAVKAATGPRRWLAQLLRRWRLYHLADPAYAFLFDPPPPGEWVALDCETTGLNVRSDEIIAIGAVRIVGNRILTSQRLELLVRPGRDVPAESVRIHRLRSRDVAQGLPLDEAMDRLLHFIGSRPLVGYYLEFDVAMLNRALWPLLGMGLPQQKIEVSALYYDHKFRQLPPYQQQANADIDLRFATLMNDLDLPQREAHDALNDAVMAALAFVKLRHLRAATEARAVPGSHCPSAPRIQAKSASNGGQSRVGSSLFRSEWAPARPSRASRGNKKPGVVARFAGGSAGVCPLRPRVRALAWWCRAQWPEAPEAPKPVSERTCCAGKAARSRAALALRSVIENSHTPMKPIAIENSAGEV